jgi:hypothetical protein
MTIAEPERKRTPFVEPVFSAFADWWRKQRDIRQSLNSLDTLDERQMTQMASDLRLSPADLRGVVRRGRDAANLLYDRMDALHLNPVSLANEDTPVMRDLQRLCSMCTSKRRCRKELAQDPENPAWREHCLNVQTLVALMNERTVKH